jgi:hypothetical protein
MVDDYNQEDDEDSREVELKVDSTVGEYNDNYYDPTQIRNIHQWEPYSGPINEPVTVCIVDSGISDEAIDTHPWFDNASIAKRIDVTNSESSGDLIGHGTACAGIIARNTPEIEFFDLRVFDESARTNISVIKRAYKTLLSHSDEIDIVNMSWGASTDIEEINDLHDKMLSRGIHDVVAAGNTGGDGGSPATTQSAFSVGAINGEGNLTRFSSSDPLRENPDIVAVGKDVLTVRAPNTSLGSIVDDESVKVSGTSFSAPYVTSAYVNAYYRGEDNIDEMLKIGSEDIAELEADGDGILKLADALDVEHKEIKANNNVWYGDDTLNIDLSWITDGITGVDVDTIEETDSHLDLRLNKKGSDNEENTSEENTPEENASGENTSDNQTSEEQTEESDEDTDNNTDGNGETTESQN